MTNGNRWHDTQVDNKQPDVKGLPCPWCGFDHGVVVDTQMYHLPEFGDNWTATAMCHECGASALRRASIFGHYR